VGCNKTPTGRRPWAYGKGMRLFRIQILDDLQDAFGVAGCILDLIDGRDGSGLVNDHGIALNGHAAFELVDGAFAVGEFENSARPGGNAEGFGNFTLVVGQQREVEVVGFLEEFLVFNGVAANGNDGQALVLKISDFITETARLFRSATGQCRGEEVEDHGLFADDVA